MGVLTEGVGGRNQQEVALRTTLMIHSDPRYGRCWKKNSIHIERAIRGNCILGQISVKARYRNIEGLEKCS